MPAYTGGKIYRHAELGGGFFDNLVGRAESGFQAWKSYSAPTATQQPSLWARYRLPIALGLVAVGGAYYFYRKSR